MKLLFGLILSLAFFQYSEAKIRNRKVKEAPRVCKTMIEESLLSRKDKKVLGTLRHSVLIEDDEIEQSITLVKDKGEKICQWDFAEWSAIQANNKLPDISSFKFFIDEYKNVIYPYVQKPDNSFFVMTIPIQTCDLSNQITRVKLELPKCEIQAKSKKRSAKKRRSVANN